MYATSIADGCIIGSMPKITLTIPRDLCPKMKAYPEIDWGEVVRRVLLQRIGVLGRMESLVAHSTLSSGDVMELDHMVQEGLRRRRYARTRTWKR